MRAALYARVSIVPESTKAPWAQLHVPYGMPDIGMAKVALNQPQVGPAFAKVVTTGVPEGMRVHIQGTEPSPLRRSVQHKLNAARRDRPAAFGHKDKIPGLGPLSLQPAQRPNFKATEIMVPADAALGTPDVENPLLQVKLLPAGVQALAYAQSVREEDKNKSGIPVAPSSLPRGFDQLFDFIFKKMLPLARPALCYCSLYGNRHHVAHAKNPQVLHRVTSRHCS